MKTYIITGEGVSMFIDGKVLSAENTHQNYEAILKSIRANDWDSIPALINVAAVVEAFTVGSDIEVFASEGIVQYKGIPLRNYLVDRIISMHREGFDINPMVKYLENLMANPSKRTVDELHKFNEYGKMPVTEDGCFIAYKIISGWYDTYTHAVFNKPAALFVGDDHSLVPYTTDRGVTVEVVDGLTTVSMPRNFVDDNAERTCSQGLHFCSHEYLKSFSGDRIVVLKINPADVVSIPVDYNNTKGRCWKYQVIDVLSDEDFKKAMGENIFTKSVYETAPEGGEDHDQTADDDMFPDEDEEDYPFTAEAKFVDGYTTGYADGRRRQDNSHMYSGDTLEGYLEGFKDGKGHNLKRYR